MSHQNQVKYGNKLHNKRIVLFGATSGIGNAVAEASLEYGAEIVISGSKQDRLDKAVKGLKEDYPLSADKVSGVLCDLSNTESLEANLRALFDNVTDNGSRMINHVVFTAGDALALTPLDEVDASNVYQHTKVRQVGALFVAKVAQHYMIKDASGDASIVLTTGTNSAKPMRDATIMAGWGSSVMGFVRGLAVDLAPHIRVNAVCAGAIQTEILDRYVAAKGIVVLDSLKKYTLVERIGQPEEIAEAYLYLMRDRNVTGQEVTSDGGRLLA